MLLTFLVIDTYANLQSLSVSMPADFDTPARRESDVLPRLLENNFRTSPGNIRSTRDNIGLHFFPHDVTGLAAEI